MEGNGIRVRFAPSPTGELHLGSARTALFNWLFARGRGGQMVLRVEDTDPGRSSATHEKSILSDLRWLGLDWDEGPDVGGPRGPYRQSERLEIYQEFARRLLEEGKAYRCYCTPEELEEKRRRALAEGRPPLYDGSCRDLTESRRTALEAAGRRPALRFRVREGEVAFRDLLHGWVTFPSSAVGDFIILRSDGRPGFHLAVVVDDALMGITHVIRGEDHLSNTPRHILLFEALDLHPPFYLHHSLLLDPDGGKMSKRYGAVTVREHRELGYLPEAILNYLALLSWTPSGGREVMRLEEMVREFDISALSTAPAIFDRAKLRWLNQRHLKALPLPRLVELARGYAPAWAGHPQFELMVEAVRDGITVLGELPSLLEPFGEPKPLGEREEEWVHGETGRKILERALSLFMERPWFDLEGAKEALSSLKGPFLEKGLHAREVLMPLRVALTGRDEGPPLSYLLAVLGPEECAERIRRVLAARC